MQIPLISSKQEKRDRTQRQRLRKRHGPDWRSAARQQMARCHAEIAAASAAGSRALQNRVSRLQRLLGTGG